MALYPICVEFLNDHGQLCKDAIAFLSDDKKHDHQQVEEFELRAFQIIRSFLNRPLHWKRFSDGCAGQFRSRFVTARMFHMMKELSLTNLSYDLLEAHEGKNTSDTIGSIVKCAFIRGMCSRDEGIANIGDMINLIKSKLSSHMKKFVFFKVEGFDFIVRKQKLNELVIPELSKIHGIVVTGDKLVASYWTCQQCRINQVCSECQKLKGRDKSHTKVNEEEGEEEVESEVDNEQFHDSEDDGAKDESDSDESDVDAEEDYGPGDIVWALYGRRWYPGQLVSMSDLPDHVRGSFKNPNSRYIVKWYGKDQQGRHSC